jgi:hypothetical protein
MHDNKRRTVFGVDVRESRLVQALGCGAHHLTLLLPPPDRLRLVAGATTSGKAAQQRPYHPHHDGGRRRRRRFYQLQVRESWSRGSWGLWVGSGPGGRAYMCAERW